MEKINEKNTPNFLLWSNPYLKEYTDVELLNDSNGRIKKEVDEAEEKWLSEIMHKLSDLDEKTKAQYLKEFNDNISKQCENIIKQIDDYVKK